MTPEQICESEYERQYNLDYLRGDITCPPLPDTGMPVWLFVTLALAFVLAGVMFVVAARRGTPQ